MLLQEECAHIARKRHGFTRSGQQRFRCKDCGASFRSVHLQIATVLAALISGTLHQSSQRSTTHHSRLCCANLLGKTYSRSFLPGHGHRPGPRRPNQGQIGPRLLPPVPTHALCTFRTEGSSHSRILKFRQVLIHRSRHRS